MQYREIGKTGIMSSIIGMGCMRLPIINGVGADIDEAAAIQLIRHAIDQGITYIDTAYNYHSTNSERIVGKALQDGYRERVTLVTKAPSWLIKTHADFEKHLDEQLQKLQVDHLDIYLLHSMNRNYWENYKAINVFEAISEAKRKGKIKNIGFSFHDQFEVFQDIISSYPWDVCMLQLNYMDMAEQAGLKGLRLAESLGIPVLAMEPLKGGLLANPPEDIRALWATAERSWSPVEWALRYVANEPNIKVILSGMSTLEQVDQNIAIAKTLEANSLADHDLALIEQVRSSYDRKQQVPCTECQYCMPCPHGVEIPKIFGYFNEAHIFNAPERTKIQYQNFVKPEGKAGNCTACGICETKCPQHIQIIDSLAGAKMYFGA